MKILTFSDIASYMIDLFHEHYKVIHFMNITARQRQLRTREGLDIILTVTKQGED